MQNISQLQLTKTNTIRFQLQRVKSIYLFSGVEFIAHIQHSKKMHKIHVYTTNWQHFIVKIANIFNNY